MTLGQRLRELRLKLGLTLKQLQEKSGVCYNSIHHYEYDRFLPPVQSITRLASALMTDVSELISLYPTDKPRRSK